MPIFDLFDSRPDALDDKAALVSGDLVLSYDRLRRDIDAVAQRLAAAGVRAGQIAGVSVGQSAAHWCVLLALVRLGAIPVSLTSRFQAEIDALPDLSVVIYAGGHALACDQAIRQIEIKADWLTTEPDPNISLPPREEAEHRFGRFCFTSGTSGRPKAIHLDPETLNRRLAGTAGRSRLHTPSVLWCGLGPDSAYGFTATIAAWMVGATVCFLRTPDRAYQDLVESHVNVIIASPAALNAVLQSRPAGSHQRMNGPVIVAGGRLSARLRDLLLADLCPEVLIAYGSAETGGVTLADARVLDHHPGAVGPIFPDVQVEVVSDTGQILPAGMPGRIRVRTPGSVAAYLNDAVATAQHFAQGWFYPGDIGQISGEGRLTLLGREADTLNVGGVKLSASEIDEAARVQAGIEDACAIVIPDQEGGVRLAIVVAGSPEAIRDLPRRLRSMLPGLPPFSLVPVSNVPRNSVGKINREAFAQEVVGLLQNPETAEPKRFSFIRA
jgi:acyl-coenzyme A synthetase/AMP-(fatty) acid ligase